MSLYVLNGRNRNVMYKSQAQLFIKIAQSSMETTGRDQVSNVSAIYDHEMIMETQCSNANPEIRFWDSGELRLINISIQ